MHLLSIKQIADHGNYDALIKKQWNEYFIDESVVSFHAPFVEDLNIADADA